jgi:serine-type D-Ala-D-Ala endopeptidase (penicillin-binding protein 7)
MKKLVAMLALAAVAASLLPGGASAAQAGAVKKKPTRVVAQVVSGGGSKRAVLLRPAARHGLTATLGRNTHAGLRAARVAGPVTRVSLQRTAAIVHIEPARPSFGQLYGLHNTSDSLDLKSSVALVMDQDTNEVLFSKNSQAVLPIASITKLMTAVVVTEAKLPMNEVLTVTDDDVDTEKFSRSRLRIGTQLNREEMLHLALMSSENRAAHALGRSYPGGIDAFVAAMNRKARELGMKDTQYVEPTGLSSRNQSSARDLATLVRAAHEIPMIREFSTSSDFQVDLGNRPTQFRTTNALVRSPSWDIGLQKTGYITEAGRCLVMQARMAGRQLIMVFLDSTGKYSRIGDAERVRRWVGELPVHVPAATGVVVKVAS